MLSFIEKENLIIDKLDFYKQGLKDFTNWEQEISKFFVNKETLEVLYLFSPRKFFNLILNIKDLNEMEKIRIAKNFICTSANSEKLTKLIEDANNWIEKYNKFVEEGPLSGYTELEIISERQQINCLIPAVDLKQNSPVI